MRSLIFQIPVIISTFFDVFLILFTDIGTLLNYSDNRFLKFFYDLAEVFGLSDFLSDISLFSLALGTGLSVVILVNVIKWATP